MYLGAGGLSVPRIFSVIVGINRGKFHCDWFLSENIENVHFSSLTI